MTLDKEAREAIEHFKKSVGHSGHIDPTSLVNLQKIIDSYYRSTAHKPKEVHLSYPDFDTLMKDARSLQYLVISKAGQFNFHGVIVVPVQYLARGESYVVGPEQTLGDLHARQDKFKVQPTLNLFSAYQDFISAQRVSDMG